MKAIIVALVCFAFYFSSVECDCNVAQKTLTKGCVNVFVLANDKAKNPDNTTNCRTQQLKDEDCSGWTVFSACVANDCEMYAGEELVDSGMHCTFKQVKDTCSGASFVSISIFTLVAATVLAMLR